MRKQAKVTAVPGEPTIVIERWFDAPPALVFRACTHAEYVRRWWGPCAMTMTTCELDFRVGGRWRFVLRDAQGHDHGFGGEYREIVPDAKIVQTFVYDPFPDAPATETCTIAAADGGTVMRIVVLHQSVAHRDGHLQAGMERGMHETHARLDELLADLRAAA